MSIVIACAHTARSRSASLQFKLPAAAPPLRSPHSDGFQICSPLKMKSCWAQKRRN